MARSTRSYTTTLLALATVGALAAPAAAEETKYKRNTQVKVDVKLSDRVRPSTAKDDGKPKGPTITADDVLEIQGAVGEIRREQIQLYEGLIEETPDSDVNEKADYYYRLAELHAQLNRYHRLKSTEAQIKADGAKGGEKSKFQALAKDNLAKAEASLRNAVVTYKKLTDNPKFRNFPQMDAALFAFAYSLQQAKYMKEARQIYKTLLDDYPQSKYVPEAYLAFADYYFGQNELANAEAFYQKVLQFPKSSVYDYSNYMLGWVYLNLAQHENAGKQFLQVIRDTNGEKKKETLNRAAKKDFVRAYADFGQVQKAWPTFQKVDADYAVTMYTILADLYLEQGKNDKAIYAFRQLMKEQPKDKNVCLWQYNIAHAMLSTPGADNAGKVAEIERLTKLYGALRDQKALPAAEASECHDNAAAMSGEMARAWHNESIKTKNPETLAYADKLYNVYLNVFGDAPDYAETQYYYSELLWSRADNEPNPRLKTELWENAAISFTNVVKNPKTDAKLQKESAYAAVLGWKNALAVDPRVKVDPVEVGEESDKIPEAKPIPEREQKMLDAFDIYIKYIKDPKDDELVGMKFLKANMYRRYHHYDEAVPLFEDIIKNHPAHETAYYSANAVLDSLILTHRYNEMLKWVEYFAANPKFLTANEGQDRSDLGERVADIQNKAKRKIAEQCEKDARAATVLSKYVECGKIYLDIFNANPEAKDADVVLYNAGVMFEEGRSLSTSIEAYTELRDRFPKSERSAYALARLGGVYGRVAYYDKAATMFEEYARKYAGQKDAYNLMNDAVFYRKGIGDDDKAIENTNYFIAKFASKKPADAANAFFSLASIYEKRGDLDKVVSHYRDYLKRYGEKGGADKVIVAYGRIGQILWEKSCPVKTVDGSCIRVVRERAVSLRGKSKRRKGDATRTQCGPESKIKLTVVDRTPADVKASMAAFASAVREFESKGGKIGGDERFARYYYALAKFHQAEVDYEKFLAIKFPQGLNFGDGTDRTKAEAAKSLKRFEEWYAEKQKVGGKASGLYQDLVFKIKEPANAIAAAARFGQISQNFSDALFTAEIPTNIRQFEDAVDIYCDALTEKAEPLEAASLAGFGGCLKASTDFGWFSSWSKLCERELGQIKPEEFPTAAELRAEPDAEAQVRDVEPPVQRLE
jgi:TolA-binding protein